MIPGISKIHVEPAPGCSLGDLKVEMSKLSNRYKCDVTAKFNGRDIIVGQFTRTLL